MAVPRPSEPQRAAIAAWLTANNIDPGLVPLDANITISTGADGTRNIHFPGVQRDDSGRIQKDSDGWMLRYAHKSALIVEPDEALGIGHVTDWEGIARRDEAAIARVRWIIGNHAGDVAADPTLVLKALDMNSLAIGWCPPGCTGNCPLDPTTEA